MISVDSLIQVPVFMKLETESTLESDNSQLLNLLPGPHQCSDYMCTAQHNIPLKLFFAHQFQLDRFNLAFDHQKLHHGLYGY